MAGEAGRTCTDRSHCGFRRSAPTFRITPRGRLGLDGTDRDGVFAFDGFSEAWFTDRPTFERAHESPAWHALRDDAPNVFDMQALDSGVNTVVDERVIKG